MEDEKGTRFAQWRRGLVAQSHVLTKAVGATITASWSVTNTGGVAAFGWLEIFFPGTGGTFLGTTVQIPAGATVTLSVSGVISAIAPGTYAAQARVRAASPGTVAPGGIHDFTLIVPPTAGAVLTASPGGPSIS
jgi:hypothetical protein